MSAEIIQFGRANVDKTPRRQVPRPQRIEEPVETAKDLDLDEIDAEAQKHGHATVVRCVCDDQIFKVKFYRGEILEISSVSHRIQNDRIVEMVNQWRSRKSFDPSSCEDERVRQIVAAARLARNKSASEMRRVLVDAAVAQVKASRERLLADAERKLKMIERIQREGLPQ